MHACMAGEEKIRQSIRDCHEIDRLQQCFILRPYQLAAIDAAWMRTS